MGISNFWGFFSLLSLVVITILYMLRPKYQLKKVASLFLWKKISEELSQIKRIEKIKKNILFFLDILIAILICLLLLGIFFNSTKPVKHKIVLINGSFSMNSNDIKPNRFEKAKEIAQEYVENLDSNDKISLILVKNNSEIICQKEDKNQVINAIKKLNPSFENIDSNKLNELVAGLKAEKSASVVYFTDKASTIGENIIVMDNSHNLAIKNMASRLNNDSITCSISVENQRDHDEKVQISLYDNNLYLSTKTVNIKAKSNEIVFFENINKNIEILKATIDKKDINPYDNSYFEIIKSSKKKKIALISEGNFFVEKFLSLNKDIDVFKLDPKEFTNLYNYDAYIFDKFIPNILPNDGNILILDPIKNPQNNLIKSMGYIENPLFKGKKHEVNQFLEDENFAISISQYFDNDTDKRAIYTVQDKLIAYSTNRGLQKIIVFGFDFKCSNLPLKPDFPVLMNNIISNLLDELMTDKYKYTANENPIIYLKPSANSARVFSPRKKIIDLNTDSRKINFMEGKELGLYRVEQESNTQNSKVISSSYFAINPPGFNTGFDTNIDTDMHTNKVKVTKFTSKKDIDKILVLILFLALLLELYLRIEKKPYARKKLLFLRGVVLILVILSLMNLKFGITSKYTDTIFIADYSESMSKNNNEINSFIENSLVNISDKDLYSVLSFGEDVNVEKPLSLEHNFIEIKPSVSKILTNIEKAAEKADLMFFNDHKKRAVLITDGRQNKGDLLKKLDDLKAKNISVDLFHISNDNFNEVEIDEIRMAKNANQNQNIQIEALVNSNINTSSKIYLYNRDKLIEKRTVKINKGENRFIFTSKLKETGILEYRVEIIPQKDTYSENNKLSKFINVEGKLKILLVENNNSGKNYLNIFDDFDIQLIKQSEVPENIENIMYYDAFILADVHLEKTSSKFIENIAKLVKNQGKSLLVSGGANSFALGAYKGSKLEEILPVNMELKDNEKKENIAMVLVIDKSGSMAQSQYGIKKISLAKEASIRASEVLDEKDYIGVIAFDSKPEWVIDLKMMSDKKNTENDIMSINSAGGTSIQPALKEAIGALENSDAPLKHIILLTDGMAESNGYEEYLNKLKKHKITLSSVAVGEGADKNILKYLASKSGGRYYVSNVFTDIPNIFARETALAGKKYLRNISFYPSLNSDNAIFSNIEQLPQLHGYIACSEKQRANVILTSPDYDPILATYNYGLGQTCAFTSDMHGVWSRDFLSWHKNKILWHNVLSEILNQKLSKNFELNCQYKDNHALLTLELSKDSLIKDKEINCEVFSSDGEKTNISLMLKAPYVYEARFNAKKDGVYILKARIKNKNNNLVLNSAFAVPYSDEFRFYNKDGLTEDEIVKASGGRIIKNASEVFKGDLPDIKTSYKLNKALLVIALILFLIELIFRMTSFKIKTPQFNILKFKSRNSKRKIKNNSQKTTSSSHIDKLLGD